MSDGIEPFRIAVDETVLDDLRRRLAATRFADDYANEDWGYGTATAALRALVDHWLHHYDWRAREAAMNALPQFRTMVDGVPIHFVHVKGRGQAGGPPPMPIVLTHGWPWTFWDFAKVIGPLADPAGHGGDPADAFDVVVPSLPGYAFSTPLRATGINFWRTADLWVALMERLGHRRFAAQGGDWGSFVSAQLGHRYPERVIGVHLHTPVPLDFQTGGKVPREDFDADEQEQRRRMGRFGADGSGYMALQKTRPQTPAHALADSPAGLLAWIVEKRRAWSDCGGDVETRFTKDELIDTAMLYWVTESFGTSARYYAEALRNPWTPDDDRLPVVKAPTALAVFPREIVYPPRRWAERYYNLQQRTVMPAGGHFAAMEEPDALVADIRAFFRGRR